MIPEIAPTNRLFLPGGGLVLSPDGSYGPSPRTIIRKDATVAYYKANEPLFRKNDAYIAVSGGRPYGLEVPEGVSEAGWLVGALGLAGIPERLHEGRVEYNAADTADNWFNALERKFFKPSDFTPEAPLGVVAGERFGKRIQLYTHCLGFVAGSVVIIETGESEKPIEDYLYAQTQEALSGMPIRDTASNIAELRRRHIGLVAVLHSEANRHLLTPAS